MRQTKAASMQRILGALPGEQGELVQRSGLSVTSVSRLVGEMLDMRWVHVARWRPPEVSGPMRAVYARGAGRDAPKPEPKNRAKGSPTRRPSGQGCEAPDALMAAFYGRARP